MAHVHHQSHQTELSILAGLHPRLDSSVTKESRPFVSLSGQSVRLLERRRKPQKAIALNIQGPFKVLDSAAASSELRFK